MTLDTKNLNESQLAEIQKQIDEIAAANKPELPLHLREPELGDEYWHMDAGGRNIVEEVWSGDSIDTASRDYGNASLDVSFLELTNEQRRAYIKILRFIAENGMEGVDVEMGAPGWSMCLDSEGEPAIIRGCSVYNCIPKLEYEHHADLLIDKCSDEIRTVLSWYRPEVNNDN